MSYCSVQAYLAEHDKELLGLFEETCLTSAITIGGRAGLTLLSPNKEYRTVIKTLLASDKDGTDRKLAGNMLLANVLRGTFSTAASFKQIAGKPNLITNALFPSRILDVNVSGSEVLIMGKKLSATSFKDGSVRGSAIWKIDGGVLPTDGKPAPSTRRGAKPIAGAYQPSTELGFRFKIGIIVENDYVSQRIAGADGRKAFLGAAGGLAGYVLAKDPECFYANVLPLLSNGCFDFYALIEPHNFTDNTVVPCAMVEAWWAEGPRSNIAFYDTYQDLLSGAHEHMRDVAIYDKNKRAKIIDDIWNLRDQLSSASDLSSILSVYDDLSKRNAICDVVGVYPEGLHRLYAQNPNRKVVEDDLRYFLNNFLEKEAGSGHAVDLGSLNYLFNRIGECLLMNNGKQSKAITLNPRTLIGALFPTERMQEITRFINSSCFLFIPTVRGDEAGNKEHEKRTYPEALDMYHNVQENDFALMEQHMRVAKMGGPIDVGALLSGIDLSPAAAAQIRERLNGKF